MKKSLDQYIAQDSAKDLLYFVTAGSVDDGKSTLIGRLLHDSKMIYEDHLRAVKDASLKKSSADTEIDMSFFTDGLKAEREQGITIDVAYRYFSTSKRKFVIIDCPGHEQYTRNMATGASNANLALVLVDAEKGISVQSRRHAFICSLLGIPHIVVVVNKMDKVGYSEKIFQKIRAEFENLASRMSIPDLHFIPVSALKGDNVVKKSSKMPWFNGTPLLEYLENVYVASDRNLVDLRFPIQYVIKDGNNHRYYAGRVASGVIRKGDKIKVVPSGKTSTISRISLYDRELRYAFANQSVAVEIKDELDISAGDILLHPKNLPLEGRSFEAILISLSDKPLASGNRYLLKNYSSSAKAEITNILYKIDVNTLRKKNCKSLLINEIGRTLMFCSRSLFYDFYSLNGKTGSFILIDPLSNNTVACGMIIDRGEVGVSGRAATVNFAEKRESARKALQSLVSDSDRREIFRQRPCTIWLTGLLSSGKRKIARELEKLLVSSGHPCVVIEGGELRKTLDAELGFSPSDSMEHIRRAAETSRLINSGGIICVSSFISPLKSLRRMAREIIGEDNFIEVHVKAGKDWCVANDETGLYRKAQDGDIKNLPGVSSSYEEPISPDLKIEAEKTSSADAAKKIFQFLKTKKIVF